MKGNAWRSLFCLRKLIFNFGKQKSQTMKYILFFQFILFIVSSSQCLFSQANPAAYDSVLAQKYGADEYGMKSYVLAILKTGKTGKLEKAVSDSLFAGHFSNMSRLANEGKLVLAGPFEKNEKTYRGLFILNVSSLEEAMALVQTDPAVKAGVFEVELFKWYGSAALMGINETHEKLGKKKM